jgi:hypothetical protein
VYQPCCTKWVLPAQVRVAPFVPAAPVNQISSSSPEP